MKENVIYGFTEASFFEINEPEKNLTDVTNKILPCHVINPDIYCKVPL